MKKIDKIKSIMLLLVLMTSVIDIQIVIAGLLGLIYIFGLGIEYKD
jgi:hypothetical protein